MADLHDTEAYKIVPGSFLSTKNTTKLTVYLWKETVKRKADHAQKKGRQMLLQDNHISAIRFCPTKQQQHPQCSACEKQL
jgi:hypothetical protein